MGVGQYQGSYVSMPLVWDVSTLIFWRDCPAPNGSALEYFGYLRTYINGTFCSFEHDDRLTRVDI